jgi:xylose isomerase
MAIVTGEKEYFKGIGQIKYEGPESDNHWHFVGMMKTGL